MKAIIAIAPKKLVLDDVPIPIIEKDTEVLMKVKAAGICGSDIHIAHGTNPYATYPRIPGHEVTGIVESIGAKVKKLKPGDRVVLEPIVYCGHCYACRKGRPNVCSSLQVRGVHLDGGFAEYMVSDEKYLHLIPAQINFEEAALIEPYTIGVQANWRGGTQAGDVVLIHGAGPIGLIALDVAKELGATCIVSELSPARLVKAAEFGADYLINPAEIDIVERIKEITNGLGANVILEATGVSSVLEQSIGLASAAATIVAFSFQKKPIPIDFSLVNKKELTIVGTRHQSYKFESVINSYDKHIDKVNKLITNVMPVEEYEEAFRLFADKNSGACKVVFRF
jgi:2-desacetyl-2-hydroxyethyl bacteriochlorophyllide A dehydrogenase